MFLQVDFGQEYCKIDVLLIASPKRYRLFFPFIGGVNFDHLVKIWCCDSWGRKESDTTERLD